MNSTVTIQLDLSLRETNVLDQGQGWCVVVALNGVTYRRLAEGHNVVTSQAAGPRVEGYRRVMDPVKDKSLVTFPQVRELRVVGGICLGIVRHERRGRYEVDSFRKALMPSNLGGRETCDLVLRHESHS
jgi:hypothetical protein